VTRKVFPSTWTSWIDATGLTRSIDVTDQGDHIPIGYVRKAHGIRGDVLVRGLVSDAAERFAGVTSLTTGDPAARVFRVTASTPHSGDHILHLEGIDTRNDAEVLIGTQFIVPASERRVLDDGEWWATDLVGCQVVDRDGTAIGTVTDVVTGAAQDRLVVAIGGGVIGEIPFVDPLVPEVDAKARRIVVDLPDGLFE
jgi:16S rRNA processing protein RimM